MKTKTGIEILTEKLQEINITLEKVSIEGGEANWDVILKRESDGKTIKQSLKTLSEIYGSLAFFHFTSEDAIKEIVKFITAQINN